MQYNLLMQLTKVGEVAREYTAQEVANTLWAYAIMGRASGERVMGLLEERAIGLTGQFTCENLRQLHQHIVSFSLQQRCSHMLPRSSLVELRESLGPACRDEFCKSQAHPSESQRQVSHALREMGLLVEDEVRCSKSGYSIDMLARDPRVPAEGGELAIGGTGGWAVEYDGPSHLLACGSPTGATLLKHRLLRLLGHNLVIVPYREWQKVRGDRASEMTYLRSLLDASSADARSKPLRPPTP